MRCDLCGKPFKDGDEVLVEKPGQWVGSKGFMQVEEDSIHHVDCGEF